MHGRLRHNKWTLGQCLDKSIFHTKYCKLRLCVGAPVSLLLVDTKIGLNAKNVCRNDSALTNLNKLLERGSRTSMSEGNVP